MLINCIREPIRKSVGGFKDETVRLFKTNISKQTMYGRAKKLSKAKTQSKIGNPFILEKKKKRNQRQINWRYLDIVWNRKREKKRKKLEKKKKLIVDKLEI